MKMREIIYDDGENFIIWSECDEGVELICVHGDKVFYYTPNKLPDMILFTELMKRLNIGENDRNGIRNYIMELYDRWRIKK